ncbi:MAG: ferrous iron transport protein B [Halobacteriota archaeon]
MFDHDHRRSEPSPEEIALIGNPSVGKSAFFTQITGVNVIISNIPQTTVFVQKGCSQVDHHSVLVFDLPGVYSIGAVTEDEKATKEYLLNSPPDAVIDIVDATKLERNLYLALELMEFGLPLVIALNQIDLLKRLGLDIDVARLEHELGAKVIPTVAIEGLGVRETLRVAYEDAASSHTYRRVDYEAHIEEAIAQLEQRIPESVVPKRTFAIKLLEGDEDFISQVGDVTQSFVAQLRDTLRQEHNEDVAITIARGRHETAHAVTAAVLSKKAHKPTVAERFGELAVRPETGFPLLFLLVGGMLGLIFYVGGYLNRFLSVVFESYLFPPLFGLIDAQVSNVIVGDALKYALLGIEAVVVIAIPYILIFFIFLAVLEDVGYLPRVAFLLDRQTHVLGLHGRSIIPLLFGYGCSVPAIMAIRTLTTRKEKIITAVLVTLVPCSARSAIIFGVVATYAGIVYAAAIYVISLVLIVITGRTLRSVVPGRTMGLVIEMPYVRGPRLVPILKKTWLRMKDFIYIAMPLIVAGSVIFGLLNVTGLLKLVEGPLAPITVGILGLPAFASIALVYGILRKEMAVEMLAIAAGTLAFSTVMSPLQIFVFGLVVTIYVPCLATLGAMVKELGWRWALACSFFTITLAIVVGGVAYYLLR